MGVKEETEVENPVVDATLVTAEAVGLEGLRSVFLPNCLTVCLPSACLLSCLCFSSGVTARL